MEPSRIQKWIIDTLTPVAQAAAKSAVDEAMPQIIAAVKEEIGKTEAKLFGEITKLPGQILGEGYDDMVHVLTDITGTTSDIANATKGLVGTLDTNAVSNAIITELRSLPIIGGLLGGQQ